MDDSKNQKEKEANEMLESLEKSGWRLVRAEDKLPERPSPKGKRRIDGHNKFTPSKLSEGSVIASHEFGLGGYDQPYPFQARGYDSRAEGTDIWPGGDSKPTRVGIITDWHESLGTIPEIVNNDPTRAEAFFVIEWLTTSWYRDGKYYRQEILARRLNEDLSYNQTGELIWFNMTNDASWLWEYHRSVKSIYTYDSMKLKVERRKYFSWK